MIVQCFSHIELNQTRYVRLMRYEHLAYSCKNSRIMRICLLDLYNSQYDEDSYFFYLYGHW